MSMMQEVLAVMVILTSLMTLFSSHASAEPDSYWMFAPDYYLSQSIAMAEGESVSLESRCPDAPDLHFTEKGNVNRAMTAAIGERGRRIVIELGPGKLVFKD